jgi:hypothetical protein
MLKTWKKKWIEALRGGKYKQTTRYLRRENNTYCCLGVICDLVAPENWGNVENHRGVLNFTFQGEVCRDLLPIALMRKLCITHKEVDILAHLNDGGSLFDDIANHIEENL